MKDAASNEPRLIDLIHPLSLQQFRDEYWAPERPFVGQASERALAAIRAIDGFASASALLAKRTVDANLFGPNGFRSTVAAKSAAQFLDAGFNLYLRDLETDLPAAKELMVSIARDLGFTPNQVFAEAFVGRAGQVSSHHYDHDINFQILLDGNKEWRIQPNTSIKNPLRSFHPSLRAQRFLEEAYTHDGTLPAPRDDLWVSHKVVAGQVVFLPRGYWHEVTSLSDTFGVNVVLKGLTVSDGFAQSLAARLDRDPRFRCYLDGLTIGDAAPPPRPEAFEALKAAAIAQLQAITFEETALAAYLTQRFRWVDGAKERFVKEDPPALHVPSLLEEPIELDENSLPPVRTIAQLQHSFTWAHALMVLSDLGPVGARNLIEDLLAFGLLEEQG